MMLTLKFKKKILITADHLALSLHLGRYHSRNSFLLLSFPSFIVASSSNKLVPKEIKVPC